MASILPEEILNTLLCSKCRQYLSFGPIKITGDKDILCGRCNKEVPSTPSLLYGEIAKYSLFPCINRYDGCNVLLRYKDVENHEKYCRGLSYVCPLCPLRVSKPNSLLYLIDHFKTVHPDSVLLEPKFTCFDISLLASNWYIFIDTLNNCLFIIDVTCTGKDIFWKIFVAGTRKTVFQLQLNDILHGQSVTGSPLAYDHDNELQPDILHIKVADYERNSRIVCKILYDISEKVAKVVAINLGSIEASYNAKSLRKLPMLYLNPTIFSGNKRQYKLSECKSQLINTVKKNLNIKLKCSCCQTYFWNILKWSRTISCYNRYDEVGPFILHHFKPTNFLICGRCSVFFNGMKYLEDVTSLGVFDLRFYCRYDCEKMYPVWQLCKHEATCEFNLEKLSDENFVKKYFTEKSYDLGAKFVNGNIIDSFNFFVAEYSYAIFGRNPKCQNPTDIVSLESRIYVVTDEGQKCKILYKLRSGNLIVHATDYDITKYTVVFRILSDNKTNSLFFEYTGGFTLENVDVMESENPGGMEALAQYVKFPLCVIWMRPVSSEHMLSI